MSESSPEKTANRDILPKNVKPIHYDLVLEVDLEKCLFHGDVTIHLDVLEDTTAITLNSHELSIQEPSLAKDACEIPTDSNVVHNADQQTITVQSQERIPRGTNLQLSLQFQGELKETLSGLFRAKYVDKKDGEKFMVASQLQPIDARRVLPCFDEPGLKATFNTTLIADKRLVCLSNMDIQSEHEIERGRKSVSFNTTPRMSTYLLCFAVGDFNYIESTDFHVPVRIYATPDVALKNARFALDLAAKTLAFFEEQFGIAFPLPKVDMIVVPDFLGAMENWGLVTFRRGALLFDEGKADSGAKHLIVLFVAHELAHQWFGNLVTMDWWEGLWLNEGFATWASVYAMHAFYPDWNAKEGLVSGDMHAAMKLDSLRSSHPVEVPIHHTSDIDQIFDDISYLKGCCMIRMAAEYLGEDVFLRGLRSYFQKHAYGNTITDDLWSALSQASGKPVKEVMGPWTRNVGFPVLTIEEEGELVHVRQNRFLRSGDLQDGEDNMVYRVPLALRTSTAVDAGLTLTQRERSLQINDDFFVLNSDRFGFYRTLYSPERFKMLTEKRHLLSTADRIGLIDDTTAFASAGLRGTGDLLELLESFHDESQLDVWVIMSEAIDSVQRAWAFQEAAVKEALKAFECKLVSTKIHELGWTFRKDGESFVSERLKVRLFRHAALAGEPEVHNAALDMFRRFVHGDHTAINTNLLGPVLETAMSSEHVSQGDYDFVANLWRKTEDSHERDTALTALCQVRKPELLGQTLALILGPDMKLEEVPTAFRGLTTDRAGIESAWNLFQTNFEAFEKKYLSGVAYAFAALLSVCVGGLSTKATIEDARSFFRDKDTRAYQQTLDQCFDEARVKANWVQRDSEQVKKWLDDRGFTVMRQEM